ncbi:UdgX family uracil-DNA binding protein [Parvularcula oceani]|uniref:UdgX family uracil-DNA binding protein n=1 Tax=Parvularcula oceani TaxID=1247963 RepID=UPI00056241A9|nr:UdgX family uracil-DNA binding protein [Parvularcula oceani]
MAPPPSAPSNAEAALAALAEDAAGCTACPLYENATRTVFGEGPAAAQIMLVGEQPGDQEDLGGEPFIGPAGQVLDTCLDEAGLDRSTVYVTNAVKHFKFKPRGRRRIHEKPRVGEIDICANRWLSREREVVAPDLVIALGASAVRGITGKSGTIKSLRSEIRPLTEASHLLVTIHPSYLLRIPDEDTKKAETEQFVADLRLGAEFVASLD